MTPDSLQGPGAPAPGAPRERVPFSAPERPGQASSGHAPQTHASPGQERRWRPGREVHLGAVLGPMRRGTGDPTHLVGDDGARWLGCRTPDGTASLRLVVRPADAEVGASAWGPGAGWLLERMPALLGADDDDAGFVPHHPLVAEAWRRWSHWRVPRTQRVLEALVPAVLEQKVTGTEAWRAWRWLVRRYGEPAPGPVPPGLAVAPDGPTWRRVPSWDWHRAGVDAKRSRTVVEAAAVAGALERTSALPGPDADARLRSLRGIGVWTAAEVRQRSYGDADAVSVGDLHLPGLVGWALAGSPVDDDGMLELLAPYAGHRYRAVRMIELSGFRAPRFAPRLAPRDFRSI